MEKFDEILAQMLDLLQREGRVLYRALKRRFELDDDYLEDLKAELIDAKHLAMDEDGKVLVWAGGTEVVSSQLSVVSSQSLTPNPQSEAKKCFLKAIEVAHKQSAKSLELRAAMSLSRLWQRQGKKEEARQVLAEIYHWFTEGFDTKDLQEAKVLLGKLTI